MKYLERVEEITDIQSIGLVSNYYGGLYVGVFEGEYYWSVKNYDGHNWQQITEELYESLIRFETESSEKE